MGIFDNIKSFLKIGRTAINKPKQDIDIESINFDDTIKTKWTGDISIWQDIDLTNNIWETEEEPTFRQKLNDPYKYNKSLIKLKETVWDVAEVMKDPDFYYNTAKRFSNWLWKTADWLWKTAEVSIPNLIETWREWRELKKTSELLPLDVFQQIGAWDKSIYNIFEFNDYSDFRWNKVKQRNKALSIFNNKFEWKDTSNISEGDIIELKNEFRREWFSNDVINEIDIDLINNSLNVWVDEWVWDSLIVQSNWYEIFWLWQKWWMDKIISGKTNTLISSFYESWDYTLENFKEIAKDLWFTDNYLEWVTKDSIERWLALYYNVNIKISKKQWDFMYDSVDNSMLSSFYKYTWNDIETTKKLVNFLNTDQDINKEDIKKQLLDLWLSETDLVKIGEDNIEWLKDTFDNWKFENNIQDITSEWNIVKEEWWILYTFDNEWNLIDTKKSEVGDMTLLQRQLKEYWLELDLSSDVIDAEIQEVAKNTLWKLWATQDEIAMVSAQSRAAFWDNYNDQLEWIEWNMRELNMELEKWDPKLAEELEGMMRENVKLLNNYKNNLLELVKIKIENQIVSEKDLEKYLQNNVEWLEDIKWIRWFNQNTVSQFLKRDENWKVINTNGWNMADYIISRSVDFSTKFKSESDLSSATNKLYHKLVWWVLTDALAWTKKPFTWGLWLLWFDTLAAQVGEIWALDPRPWMQRRDIWRNTFYNVADVSDEFAAFFLWDIVITGWAWFVKKVITLPKYLTKFNKVSQVAKSIDNITDMNKVVSSILKWYKWNKAKSIELWVSWISNLWLYLLRDANIEVQANRIDPDRWQDFNTNLAIWTLIAPRFFDARRALKASWLIWWWISNFDVVTSMNSSMTWKQASNIRKELNKAASSWFTEVDKGYWKLTEEWRKTLKANIWSSMIVNKEFKKQLTLAWIKRDPIDIMIDDPELFYKYIWKTFKNLATDKEINWVVDWLIDIINRKDYTPADVISYLNDIPWQVSIGSLVKRMPDTNWSQKVLSDIIKEASSKWELFNVQYVWDDIFLWESIKYVFWTKFTPWKVFTNRELNVARSRADDIQWKPIQNILDEKFFDWYWLKVDDWYILNKQGRNALWIYEAPSKWSIKRDLAAGDRKSLWESMVALYWKWADSYAAEGWIIDSIEKILSDKIC